MCFILCRPEYSDFVIFSSRDRIDEMEPNMLHPAVKVFDGMEEVFKFILGFPIGDMDSLLQGLAVAIRNSDIGE